MQVDVLNCPIPQGQSEQTHSANVLQTYASVRNRNTVPYPTVANAVNDYNTPGLMAQAFPCLFPYGVGDMTTRDRDETVSEAEGAKHYIKYCVNLKHAREALKAGELETNDKALDNVYNPLEAPTEWLYPFVEHDRFIHWIQNMVERHRAQGQRNFWIGRNDKFSSLSNEELLAIINEQGEEYDTLLGSMQSYNGNINGSPQYLFKKRKLLEAMIDQLGMPTMWFTFSIADNHWTDLHELLHRDMKGQPVPFPDFGGDACAEASWKRKVVRKNPHLVDAYFQIHLRNVLKIMFGTNGLESVWHWFRIEYQNRGAPHAHGCVQLKHDPDLTKLADKVISGRIAARMLRQRDLLPANVIDPYHLELDTWLEREQTVLPELSTAEKLDLLQEIDAGNTAHSKIVAFYDFMVTAMHIEPPSDAMADERDRGTCFDATNPSVHHPSSICPRYVINDRESMASLYAKSLSVQYRHIHQAYCDRNYDARQRAKAAVANGTLGPRQKRPEDIPVDCRFSFPKPI